MAHAYLTGYTPLFPKPSQIKQEKPWIKIVRDGREVLDTTTVKGAEEYKRRKWDMRDRQKGRCCLEGFIPECPGLLRRSDCTFEHEDGRGGGKRDDRIVLPDGTWLNGASHSQCNYLKGSRYIPFNAHRPLVG